MGVKKRTVRIAIGVGDTGCSILQRLDRNVTRGMELIAVDTHNRLFKIKDRSVKKILIGKDTPRGRGTSKRPAAGAMAAIRDYYLISKAMGNPKSVFIIAGVGDGTGNGAGPVIADMAKQKGARVDTLAIYPSNPDTTGEHKADHGLRKLKAYSNNLIVMKEDRLNSMQKVFEELL